MPEIIFHFFKNVLSMEHSVAKTPLRAAQRKDTATFAAKQILTSPAGNDKIVLKKLRRQLWSCYIFLRAYETPFLTR